MTARIAECVVAQPDLAPLVPEELIEAVSARL